MDSVSFLREDLGAVRPATRPLSSAYLARQSLHLEAVLVVQTHAHTQGSTSDLGTRCATPSPPTMGQQ